MKWKKYNRLWVPKQLQNERGMLPGLFFIQQPAVGGGGAPGTPIAHILTPIVGLNHNDAVSTWNDETANNNDGTSSGSPTYQSSSNTINGLPTVFFNGGAGDYLTFAVNATGWSEATVGFVVKASSDPSTGGGAGMWTLSSADFNSHYPYTDGVIYDNAFTTARKTVGNPTPALTDAQYYIVRSKASQWDAHLSGAEVHSTGTNTFSGRNGLEIMRSSTSGSLILDGFLAEFIVYDSYLDNTALADLESYFAARFSI